MMKAYIKTNDSDTSGGCPFDPLNCEYCHEESDCDGCTKWKELWKKCQFLEFEGIAGNFCWHPNRVNVCLEEKCPMPPISFSIKFTDDKE